MFCSGTTIAWVTLFSKVALAEAHTKGMNHDWNHGSASQRTHSRRLISNLAISLNDDSSYQSKVSTVTTSLPITQPTIPTCDATQPKLAINSLLVQYNEKLRELSDSITDLTNQVVDSNSQKMVGLITAELQKTITASKSCTSSIQQCGIDPRPLIANKGKTLSDVSWSALQIVLTMKTIFESVSCLYQPFPIVQKTCSSMLLSLSTELASLIGACSMQLNLFDTRFFPLVTPQLKEFMEVDDNFSAFFGSFVPT